MVVFDMATRVYRIYTKDTLLLNMLVFQLYQGVHYRGISSGPTNR